MTAPDGVNIRDFPHGPRAPTCAEPLARFGAELAGVECVDVECAPGTKHHTHE